MFYIGLMTKCDRTLNLFSTKLKSSLKDAYFIFQIVNSYLFVFFVLIKTGNFERKKSNP
ncbi:hypothetical protein Sta7437_2257 [Stanieria cyanosphaera PCC 7437]|uniref:Uncharacterized protein n=1 Tax=Stanieria cyanosphaera (strain ATCC 29371 / PCC 7437) TaxID=111780 RepID=K9XUP5_STAC7|nr:hypothetical protein Sta7437_2257 [Stanieria cyanosphaera PCC 7437]